MGDHKKLSIFISLVLRHQPEAAGIVLDDHGWADVEELIRGILVTGRKIDKAMLEEIVAADEKQRYCYNEDKTMIRASQGHSIKVDVEPEEKVPPEILYHGTATRFLSSIMSQGLKPMSRLYVHLTNDYETAVKTGQRHGAPVVLEVKSGQMYRDGYLFYLSENGVWLTKAVEKQYIDVGRNDLE